MTLPHTPFPASRLHTWLPFFLLVFLAMLIPGLGGYEIDRDYWTHWVLYTHEHGLRYAYGSGTNYPPLYQYVLWIFGKLCGNADTITRNIGYLRLFTLAAEYWGLWLVYRWTDRRVDYTTIVLFSIFNVAFSYNTVLWGQVDGMLAALCLATLYYVWKGRLLVSALFMLLSLNLKLQAIVYLPVWGLLMLSSLHRQRRWRHLPLILLAMAGLEGLLMLPFSLKPGGALQVWYTFTGLVDAFHWITLHAFNFWYWVAPDAGPGNPDNVRTFSGLSYYHTGLILFSLALLISLYPLLRHTTRSFGSRAVPVFPREALWLTGALCTLVFFFFNTRIHERYGHPAFIFITAYAFYYRRFGLYLLFSLAIFLNMEGVQYWLRLRNYGTFIFDPKFIAALYGGCIVWAWVLIYRADKSVLTDGALPISTA